MFNYCLNLSDKHIEILYFASKHVFLSQLSSSWPYEFLEIQWWQNDCIVGAVSEFRRNQDNSKNNILVSQKQKSFQRSAGYFCHDVMLRSTWRAPSGKMMKPNTRQHHKFTGCNENISFAHLITRRRRDFSFCVWQSTPSDDIFLWHMLVIFMMIMKMYSERRTDESVESNR